MLEKWQPCEYKLLCRACDSVVDEKISHARCLDCEGPLDVEYNVDALKKKGEFPYFFPLKNEDVAVSLQEGETKLYDANRIASRFGLKHLFVKNEATNPTGVFKDRGSFVEISKARELGAKALIVASSGNMAASCSAYAAKAGIPIYILVPEHVPIGKLAQMLSYGAHVIKIHGTYDDCLNLVHQLAPQFDLYLVGDYVFRREGQKSLAYELVEQFEGKVPDVVICPTGAGTHVSALWRGFQEYKAIGITDSLPRMVLVQPEHSSVLVDAFEKGEIEFTSKKSSGTVCTAVEVDNPNDGTFALEAIYDSDGTAVKVSDEAALDAQQMLARDEGLFIEHSSALSIAAIPQLLNKKIIQQDDRIVSVGTGNGLKDPLVPLHHMPKPPDFKPDLSRVSEHLGALISQE